jgi:hypothetical protein
MVNEALRSLYVHQSYVSLGYPLSSYTEIKSILAKEKMEEERVEGGDRVCES